MLVGPNFRDVDVSAFKTTSVGERVRLEFRAEAFNVLNRANFNLPGSFNVFSATTISPAAGVILEMCIRDRPIVGEFDFFSGQHTATRAGHRLPHRNDSR